MFDGAARWSEQIDQEGSFRSVAAKLRNYESMTWHEITSRDHSVSQDKLILEARKRLQHIRLDDIEELWRFEITGRRRIWGIRHGSWFYALWWDAEHVVCPSKKKGT